jgi:hypothetical protein
MHVMDTEPGAENGGCYVSALSEHPDPTQAAADVTAEVLERLGAAAEAVLGPRREVEEPPGVSLFAARLGSPAVPVRLHADATGLGWQISDLPSAVAGAWDLRVCVDDHGARGVLRSSAS